MWTADVAAHPVIAETRTHLHAVEPIAEPVPVQVALTRRQLRERHGPLVSGPLNEPEAVAASITVVPAAAEANADEPWIGAPPPMIRADGTSPSSSDSVNADRQPAKEVGVPATVTPFVILPLEATEATEVAFEANLTEQPDDEPHAKTATTSSLNLAVTLMAILPLAQLVAVVATADTFVTPQGSWMRYALLGAPAILSLLLAAIDRKELLKAEQVSLPPVAFAIIPPLYLAFRALRVGRKSSVLLVVWLVLQAAAVAVLVTVSPAVFASLTQLGL